MARANSPLIPRNFRRNVRPGGRCCDSAFLFLYFLQYVVLYDPCYSYIPFFGSQYDVVLSSTVVRLVLHELLHFIGIFGLFCVVLENENRKDEHCNKGWTIGMLLSARFLFLATIMLTLHWSIRCTTTGSDASISIRCCHDCGIRQQEWKDGTVHLANNGNGKSKGSGQGPVMKTRQDQLAPGIGHAHEEKQVREATRINRDNHLYSVTDVTVSDCAVCKYDILVSVLRFLERVSLSQCQIL